MHSSIHPRRHPSIQPTTGRVGRHRPRRASDTDGWMAFVCFFLCRVCAYLRTVVRTYSTVRGSARPVVTQKNASAGGRRDATRRDATRSRTRPRVSRPTRRDANRLESSPSRTNEWMRAAAMIRRTTTRDGSIESIESTRDVARAVASSTDGRVVERRSVRKSVGRRDGDGVVGYFKRVGGWGWMGMWISRRARRSARGRRGRGRRCVR